MGGRKRSGRCPFCGAVGSLSDEHVWGQWLHETASAKRLLSGSHGERLSNVHTELSVSAEGRIQAVPNTVGKIHKHLPEVKVDVCARCNNEWMSALEERVKNILGPYIFGLEPWVKIGVAEVEDVAAWVVKGNMAYCTNRQEIKNPFTPRDYQFMAKTHLPPAGCQVWMFNSHHSRAQVGLAVYFTYLSSTFGLNEMIENRDNYCISYFAAACVVFVVALIPAQLPNVLVETLLPDQLKWRGVRRIWPNPRAQYFPLEAMPDPAFEKVLGFADTINHNMGLPSVGLDAKELGEVRKEFLEGKDPQVIRKEWEH